MTTVKLQEARKKQQGKEVTFEYYAPEAQKVSVAGTFNDWKEEKAPLKKEATGKWKLALTLPSGRYEYRYLVDGVWQNDQRPAECIPNAFGSWNCVLEVK